MEIIWLASPDSACPNPPFRLRDIVVRNSVPTSERAVPIVIILEVAGRADEGRALSLIETSRGIAPVVVFHAEATVASSVRWMKAGAAHVAICANEIEAYVEAFRTSRSGDRGIFRMRQSHAAVTIEADIALVANRRCNLLIEGETGTGKEVVARETHARGDRCRGPWVAVNCGAIPEPLLEAELFGHVKGAFTGAVQSRAGKFEAANHGTLFLDEIGDMPLAVQSKLLRVLQEREIERLGGNECIKLDVRVIAATNANLAARVEEGLFRQDLYYRLNVFRMVLPPLRARPEDIAGLAQLFIDKICRSERFPPKSLDPAAMDQLRAHSWPGNIRELENAIETAVIVSGARTTIFRSDLRFTRETVPEMSGKPMAAIELPPQGLDYQQALEEFEQNLLRQALARVRGNKTAAADLLGLKRTTLAAKMRALESRIPGPRVPRLVA